MLFGAALFDAQAFVFGRFLAARTGLDFIGTLVDAQLNGKTVDELITQRQSMTLEQLDVEWRRWLGIRAAEIAGPAR